MPSICPRRCRFRLSPAGGSTGIGTLFGSETLGCGAGHRPDRLLTAIAKACPNQLLKIVARDKEVDYRLKPVRAPWRNTLE
jgi:hypothetical protein